MKRRIDLDHLNPVSDDQGERWLHSPAGDRVREQMLARATVAIGTAVPSGHRRRFAAYLAPVAALALIVTTVVFVRDDGRVPVAGGDCAVTFASPPYLVPPEPWPATPPPAVPPHESHWYGTEDLWTIIRSTGAEIYAPGDKLFYWSRHFMTASDDFEEPEITVTAERLDGEAPTVTAPQANNGGRGDTGTFMLTGLVLPTPGCWEITAEYRGASLSYVVEVVSGFESDTDPCQDVFRAVGSDQSPLEGVGLADAIPAALTSLFEVSSFTCVSTQQSDMAWVRGVFVELVDERGIGAVYAVLHDRESETDWRGYLAETFPGLALEFELGDKWILGVNTTHPRASEVAGALSDPDDIASLWAAARDALEAGSYAGR